MTASSVVIVTWNSAREVAALLPTLEMHYPRNSEVIVVDNASEDRTKDVVRRWPNLATLIELDHNVGFGAANNIGVRCARGDVIILLNPDTLLIDDSLLCLSHLALMRRALCGPELLNPDGSRQPSASPRPGGWESGLTAVVPAAAMPPTFRERCEPWRSQAARSVGWLTGACIAGPRAVLIELGPFDERIHLFGEDMDLGLRAHRRGIASIFAPNVARVVHLGGRSTAKRFDDAGMGVKLRNRRVVVRRELGRARELYDFATQILFHSTRYVAKTLLRRDTTGERVWLTCASRYLLSTTPNATS